MTVKSKGYQKRASHGSVQKTGKVRESTKLLKIEKTSTRKKHMPRVDRRRRYNIVTNKELIDKGIIRVEKRRRGRRRF